MNADGSFSFTPNADYSGPDSSLHHHRRDGDVSTATATINVAPVNDVPVAADDTLSAVEDTPLTGSLATNDTPVGRRRQRLGGGHGPSNGTVTVGADGSFSTPRTPTTTVRTASPTPSPTPMATSRPRLQRSTSRRRVTPPIALDDTATTAEDTPVIIGVLGNDSDPDGDTLTITEVAGGQPIGLGSR